LLKRTVEDRFGFVRLRGELSGVKRAASGHLYCCLKDEGAVIDGVMWRGGAQRLGFVPEDGIEVVASGKLTTYPGRSTYQIVIERMEIAGEGALLALLAKLKARLEAEGLFDRARKRALPFLPRVIGVVTSPTGAVIRDILQRLSDRFPSRVLVWPVLVQGQDAAAQVANAVRGFSELAHDHAVPRPDMVIVARGGGSIEDLWAFNEEAVVRAIAASTIPVISAVGHETDTTLADFAADLRAPTPTAAAELAVPVHAELATQLAELALRKRRGQVRALGLAKDKIEELRTFSRLRGARSYDSIADGNDDPGTVGGVAYLRAWNVARYVYNRDQDGNPTTPDRGFVAYASDTGETPNPYNGNTSTGYVDDVEFKRIEVRVSWIDASGQMLTRAAVIASFSDGTRVLESGEISDLQIRVYGSTAVVTGRSVANGRANGTAVSIRQRFTDVFVKNAVGWQIVASQATRDQSNL